MTGRRSAAVGLATLVAFLALSSTALAEFRGTDMWSNLMPGGGSGLADRYPISSYQLDYAVDAGPFNPKSVPALVAQFASSWIFFLAALAMRLVIAIFVWSFDLDVVMGGGGLSASSSVVRENYDAFVQPFLATIIVCLGAWIAVKAVKRDKQEISSALARVLVLSVVAIALVFYPEQTIGRAYELGDDVAGAVVSLGEGPDKMADRMFETWVLKPWVMLEFGGLEHCVSAGRVDDDGFPISVDPSGRGGKVCRDHMEKDAGGRGGYAKHFLSRPYGSVARNAEVRGLIDGEVPDVNPTISDCPRGNCSDGRDERESARKQFDGRKIDKSDAPAADMMQAGGSLQRLVYVVVVVVGIVAAIMLLALLTAAILFAQVALLLLHYASWLMVLLAAYPGFHGIVLKWLKAIGKALAGKVVYAFLLGVLMATSSGLMAIGGASGYFVVFVMQSVLFAGVLYKRKELIELATSSSVAKHYSQSEHHAVSFAAAAATGSLTAISGGAGGFAATMREGWQGKSHEAASHTAQQSVPERQEVARAEQDPVTSSTPERISGERPGAGAGPREENDVPTRTFSEDLNDARARSYDREEAPDQPPAPPEQQRREQPVSAVSGIASASTFERDVEQERRERELARRE